MKKDKRTHRLNLHLNSAETELFKAKAKNYPNISAMVRDAVAQFNDQATMFRLDALNELSSLIRSFSTELSKQGGNLNQAQKRANELIYSGCLNREYFDEVLMPQFKVLQELISEVQAQQSAIFKKVMKL